MWSVRDELNEEPARGFAEYEYARGQRDVSLAQQVERTEFNGEVAGSNPSGYQADVLLRESC